MAYFLEIKFMFVSLLLMSCMTSLASSRGVPYTPPSLKRLTDIFPHLPYNQSFNDCFGGQNIQQTNKGSNVNIALDKSTGSGFMSKNQYNYGFFSTAIKLPAGYSSGVVVAFYMSNSVVFPHNHDEIDLEFLGHENRKQWILQTNIYGNGSTHTGREEKFRLWFDPSQQFHQYSILWNNHHTIFFVDNVPIRQVNHSQAMSPSYPSKPMYVYSTIWDASDWATNGGKSPVNYKFAPFIASFGEMEMEGCMLDSTKGLASCDKTSGRGVSTLDPVDGEEFAKLSQEQKSGMEDMRKRFMIYSYCKDPARYKVLPGECNN